MMVATLQATVLQRPTSPLTLVTVRLTRALARLSAVTLALPPTRQPAAVWMPHALRGVQNPQLMYSRLRAMAERV